MIKQMERIARDHAGVVSLGQGIPSIETSPLLHDGVRRALETRDVDAYSDPQGLLELRSALSSHLRKYRMDYSADEIIVTSGAIEALAATLQAIVTPDKNEVITPTPVYSSYFNSIALANGTVIEHPLIESENWRLDVDQLAERINEHTAAIVVCNPNNPTGTIYDQDTMRQLAELAQSKNIKLIIDEVYRNITYDEQSFYSPAEDPNFKTTVIRIMSFSKDFSLTGWRVGYLHADSTTIEAILGVHDTLVNCAPVISQYMALEALTNFDEIITHNLAIYKERRQQIMNQLDELQDVLSYSMPRAGYCVFVRIVAELDDTDLAMRLAEAGVVTIPGSAFGVVGSNYLRLCFGRSEHDIHKGMQIIREVLRREH